MALTTQQQALVNSAKAGHPVTIDQMTAAGFTLSTFNTAVMGVDNGAANAQAASSTPSTPVTPVAPTPAQQVSNAIQLLQTYGPNTYNALQTAGLLDQLQQQIISNPNVDSGILANQLLATYQQQQAAAQQQAAQQAAAAQAAQVAAYQAAQAQQQALVNTANTAYSTLQDNVTQANLDAYNAAAKAAGITPADTSGYQTQITQQAALQTAEANFSLPDPTTYNTTNMLLPGGNGLNTITQTDPMGNNYTLMPADPSTGAPAQWYKDTGGGAMQAVNANGQPQPNAPVIPGNQFTVQFSKVQNDVTAQQAQVQQAQQLTQINALPEVQAYQTAYANMQAAIAKGDPQAETDSANALNTAAVALQNSNNPLLQTDQGVRLATQDIAQNQSNYNQYSGAEAAYQQQQATQQSQLLAQQAAAAATTQNATNALNNDYKDLSKAQQAILGPISPTSSLTDVQNTAQTAYQNALTAYQNNKSTDPTVTAQLAQNLQDAAYVNQVVTADTQPNNNSAYVQAHNAFNTAQSQNAQAQNTLDQSQVAQAAAAQQAANEAAQNSSPLGDLFSSVGSFVDNNIPGGWATIGAAALLAVGVVNPDLLGLADSGTLTPEAVTNAGFDPATVSTNLANGLADGTIAPESVGLSTAPTIGADGTITTVASDGATTTAAADGTVSTTAADGTVAPTTASGTASTGTVAPETGVPAETTPVAPDQTAALNTNQVGALSAPEPTPVAPTNTISTTLPDGSVGSYDPATGTVYNADGSVNAAATNAAPTPGAETPVASNAPGVPEAATNAADTTPVAPSGTSMFSGSSINPIANALTNAGITNPIVNGALSGIATNAGIDLVTGKPITASGLLTSAATGGIAGELGTLLPDATGSLAQAAINGAVTSAGANAIVDVATGKPLSAGTLAAQAAIGAAVGGAVSGVNSSVNNPDGTTTYTWDDGSTMTTNGSGTPTSVSDSSGAVVSLGTVNPTTGATTPNSAVQTPTNTVNNNDGTSTQTYDDGSKLTTNNTTGATVNDTGPVAPAPSPTVPADEIPATTATNPAGTVNNNDGTTTTTYGDGSTETTNNTTGATVNITGPVAPEPSPTVPADEIPATTATNPAGTVDNGDGTSTQTYDDGSQLTTDNTTGDVVNTTTSTDNGTTGATVDSGTSAAVGATTAGTQTTTTQTPGQGFLPIPTFTGEALTNPGTNPGYIEPTPQYNPSGVAGLDQYYWGQQGVNAPAAPATGYGQASQLGQLITPQNLGYPTAQSMAAAGLQYNPQVGILQRDAYNNPVQMNTLAPAVPGIVNSYGPTTPAESATGYGGGVQFGQNLNYIAPATQLSGTPSAGLVPAGTFTAISPTDLAAQLQAQATSAGLTSAGTSS